MVPKTLGGERAWLFPDAGNYDSWYLDRKGRRAAELENELFRRLVRPTAGQKLLEIGCGTGHNLAYFDFLGLAATGIEMSSQMLSVASAKLSVGSRLIQGDALRLPFADNSFDVVALITTLEFVADPVEVVVEAARVCRDCLYLGVLNKTSVLGIQRRVKARLQESIYQRARFYTIRELETLLYRALGRVDFHWESTLVLPLAWTSYMDGLERTLSFKQNPFGGFLGVRVNCRR
jgi:ubiquinone/menaquinone biosynthesis C-methylase UbiE